MTSRDFCFWLQGYFEVAGEDAIKRTGLNARQCQQVKAHLSLVFKHEIDPSMGENQTELNDIHGNDPLAHTHEPGVRC